MFNSPSALPRLLRYLACVSLLALAAQAHAGVTPERTRVIFPAGSSEVNLRVANANPYPVMVQTWIDDGALDSTPDKSISAFMSLPPVFPLLPLEQRTLRVLFTGDALPKDRESLFWLNLYEFSPTAKGDRQAPEQQRLVVAMRTQIKVFHRPADLPLKAEQAAGKLVFSARTEGGGVQLRIDNPSPYYVTISSLQIRQGAISLAIAGDMLAPLSSLEFPARNLVAGQDGEVRFNWIDDDGNVESASAVLR